jgi:hypothetical protein
MGTVQIPYVVFRTCRAAESPATLRHVVGEAVIAFDSANAVISNA